tara:strand:+ start:539 stop:1792 length:1254 start_codon:yes stop_codon:yes gene_type:complete
MAEIHFYLRDQLAEKTTIYASVSYDGYRVKISTEIRILSRFWNSKKQRVKELMEFSDNEDINADLIKMSNVLEDIYKRHREEGELLKPTQFKDEFYATKDLPILRTKAKSFWDHFEAFISFKRNQLSDVRDYHNSLRKHLIAVELKMKRPLSYRVIKNADQQFLTNWEQYLKFEAINSKGEKGLSMNTVGKQNKNLKVFLNWSFDRGIYAQFSVKAFPTLMEEVDNIYLTEKELISLMKVKLIDKKKQNVRDLFLIGCETGLRFSDFTRMTDEHIQDGYLTFLPKKTQGHSNNKIIIPLSERFIKILDSNKGEVPSIKKMTITEFNKLIRVICKSAGIEKELKRQREVAGKKVIESYFRYQEVSSHTCRRTFCTLKFLKGMPAQAIMKFSGHRTERNFLKYLKLDAELTARKYGEFF